MHPTTRASREEHPIPCGGAVCGIPGPGCEAARAVSRLQAEIGWTSWRPRPEWSCERAEVFLVAFSQLKPPGRPSLHGDVGASPQVVVRLPAELKVRAVRAASARGTPLSALVRAALERHLDALAHEPPPVRARPAPAPSVLLIAERSRARTPPEEPFDAAAAYAEADAADAAPAAGGPPCDGEQGERW